MPEPDETLDAPVYQPPKRAGRRVWVWWGVGLGLLAVLVAAGLLLLRLRGDAGLRGKPRRAWKDQAIAEVTRRTADAKWLASELESLKINSAKDPDEDAWISDHLLLMKNGEWIIYASICQKEDARIPDLFIGRGSDGKWYYSTFHFCRAVVVLRMDGQSESLAKFIGWYYLNEFDGRSDECLAKTWPRKHGQVDPKASERGPW